MWKLPTLNSLILLFTLSAIGAEAPPPPTKAIVGAIRWDAWFGELGVPGKAVEKSLGPKKWHYRLPFFAKEISDTQVEIRGNTQEIMDREIAYAKAGGLDYWAFCTYAEDSPMSMGLKLYLSSTHKADIHFCLNLQGGHIGAGGPAAWPKQIERYVGYFKEPSYQKVAGRRPLVYLFMADQMIGKNKFSNWESAKAAIDALKKETIAAGLASPYLVIQTFNPNAGKQELEKLGFDALSAYAVAGGGDQEPYEKLMKQAHNFWEACRGTGKSVIPIVSAGWDRRPRVENPVPWEGGPGNAASYVTPKPDELAAHLKDAIDWIRQHPESTPSNAILMYAWNENDEGGWLTPTLFDGSARLDDLGKLLKP